MTGGGVVACTRCAMGWGYDEDPDSAFSETVDHLMRDHGVIDWHAAALEISEGDTEGGQA